MSKKNYILYIFNERRVNLFKMRIKISRRNFEISRFQTKSKSKSKS